MAPRMAAWAVGDPSHPLGGGVALRRGGAGQGLGAVGRRQEPRRGARAWPGGPSGSQEPGRQPGVPVLTPVALLDAEAPAVTVDGGLPSTTLPEAVAPGHL